MFTVQGLGLGVPHLTVSPYILKPFIPLNPAQDRLQQKQPCTYRTALEPANPGPQNQGFMGLGFRVYEFKV